MIGAFIPFDDEPTRVLLGWVVQENGCWDWVGSKSWGYGMVRRKGYHDSKAHRISYERHVGPIPAGLTIDHLCRNRACGNPAHLEVVTMRENALRGGGPPAQNARKTHCPRGHPLSGANLYRYPSGRRWCRICRRESQRNDWEGL